MLVPHFHDSIFPHVSSKLLYYRNVSPHVSSNNGLLHNINHRLTRKRNSLANKYVVSRLPRYNGHSRTHGVPLFLFAFTIVQHEDVSSYKFTTPEIEKATCVCDEHATQ